MTAEEQEALSHQHSHGIWLVGLEDGSFAVFDHPNGKLQRVIPLNQSITASELIGKLILEVHAATQRHSERRRRYLPESVTLEDLDL